MASPAKIFISYGREDRNKALEVYKFLEEAELKPWLDEEDILPGQDWEFEINKAIADADFFITCISSNVVNREGVVHQELKLALERLARRPQGSIFLIPIRLDETPVPVSIKGAHWLDWQNVAKRPKLVKAIQQELEKRQRERPTTPPDQTPPKVETTSEEAGKSYEKSLREKLAGLESLTDEIRSELIELGIKLGLDKGRSERIREVVLRDLGLIAPPPEHDRKYRILLQDFLGDGQLSEAERIALENTRKALEITPKQSQRIVQQETLKLAEAWFQTGDVQRTRNVLAWLLKEYGDYAPAKTLLDHVAKGGLPPKSEHPEKEPEEPSPGSFVPPSESSDEKQTPNQESIAPPFDVHDWVRVPEGEYIVGCPRWFIQHIEKKFKIDAGVFNAYPHGSRRLKSFWITRLPITNEQYWEFVRATRYRYPSHWRGRNPPFSPQDRNKPVTNISWEEAQAYCDWAGLRLPTNEEWEKAARGREGFIYPWGNEFSSRHCNTSESNFGELLEGGQFPGGVSPWGAIDMVGNVWEWTDGGEDTFKTMRGSSWKTLGEIYGATFFAMHREGADREDDVGFRCVRDGLAQKTAPPPADLVEISAGEFWRGCPEATAREITAKLGVDSSNIELLLQEPYRQVFLPRFYLARYPVTNAEYWEFVREKNYALPSHWNAKLVRLREKPFPARLDHCPIVNVSHHDAQNYCDWRGVRLPTALEWEKAARGIDDRVYPWGNEFSTDKCNTAESLLGRVVPVWEYPEGKSPFGLYNMCGNILEWTSSGTNLERELRGGSYKQSCEIYGLTFYRQLANEMMRDEHIGFRVAKD